MTFCCRPTVTNAFASVQYIITEANFGWLIRSVHRWSASIMVLMMILHIFSAYLTGGFKKLRELTWVTGVVLVVLTASMPCGNDSSSITTFTTMMLSIDQIISWIGFHLTVYGSIACARDESLIYSSRRGDHTYLNKVYDWFEERLEIQAIADDITSKYVPPHVNIFYCLGGITFTCFFSTSGYRICYDLLLSSDRY
ncbi:putative cytochrome b/b6, di-hem cytochrome, transmembrane, cytochrome b/b6-like domain superfamily [Helianthus anomalus]